MQYIYIENVILALWKWNRFRSVVVELEIVRDFEMNPIGIAQGQLCHQMRHNTFCVPRKFFETSGGGLYYKLCWVCNFSCMNYARTTKAPATTSADCGVVVPRKNTPGLIDKIGSPFYERLARLISGITRRKTPDVRQSLNAHLEDNAVSLRVRGTESCNWISRILLCF